MTPVFHLTSSVPVFVPVLGPGLQVVHEYADAGHEAGTGRAKAQGLKQCLFESRRDWADEPGPLSVAQLVGGYFS